MEPGDALDYRTPGAMPRRQKRWRIIQFGILGTIAAFLILSALLPGGDRFPQAANKIRCSSNLRKVVVAMMLYANDHDGRFPDSLEEVLATEDISTEAFVCPASADTRATGPSTQAILVDFTKPGRCSYIYLGKGLTSNVTDDVVLAYEPLSDHGNTGMNVLFGDGHVEFVNAPGVLPWIAAAKGGPVVRPMNAANPSPATGGE